MEGRFEPERLEAELRDSRGEVEALRNQNRNMAERIAELEGLLEASRSSPRAAQGADQHQGGAGYSQLRKQVKDFTLTTQMELERKLTRSMTRATFAEEQLEELQKYMTQSTVSYQKEIKRLQDLLAHHPPSQTQHHHQNGGSHFEHQEPHPPVEFNHYHQS